jgi:holo-[acyl-carrier protein] synthase
MKGVGIDTIDIDRMKRCTERWGDRFLLRIFTRDELSYCRNKRFFYQHLSGRFAVKEAVMKAMGAGWPLLSFTDIEIINSSGAPKVRLRNAAERMAKEKGITSILISITHTDGTACAIALCQ